MASIPFSSRAVSRVGLVLIVAMIWILGCAGSTARKHAVVAASTGGRSTAAVVARAGLATRAQTSPAGFAWPEGASYLHGANVPWFTWSCDFGCGSTKGGASDPTVGAALDAAFQQARAAGMHFIRWWMFEGNPWQITTDSAGAPNGINPAVYADIDAALQLAQSYDLYFDFVLFSGPTAIPSTWLTDAHQRSQLAATLAPLFAHYANNPYVFSWEVFNEPEFDIWNKKIGQAPVQATVRAIADAVHANSAAYVTVGSAMLDGLPLWVGQGLDYYQAHWYDYMDKGNYCAICTDYATVQQRYQLDAPLVIGELYIASDVKPSSADRFTYFYTHGYAGAWPWSLFPDHTSDQLSIDLSAAQTFAMQYFDSTLESQWGAIAAIAAASFKASAAAAPGAVTAPGSATLSVSVASGTDVTALVDVEIYSPSAEKVFQQAFDNEGFAAGQTKSYNVPWQVDTSLSQGTYTVKVGVFHSGWGKVYAWNDNAAQLAVRNDHAPPPPSFGSTAGATPSRVAAGGTVTMAVAVKSQTQVKALVDVEVYDPANDKVFQKAFDDESFAAGDTKRYSLGWQAPTSAQTGTYTVKVGVFKPGWAHLYSWNDKAAQFSVGR